MAFGSSWPFLHFGHLFVLKRNCVLSCGRGFDRFCQVRWVHLRGRSRFGISCSCQSWWPRRRQSWLAVGHLADGWRPSCLRLAERFAAGRNGCLLGHCPRSWGCLEVPSFLGLRGLGRIPLEQGWRFSIRHPMPELHFAGLECAIWISDFDLLSLGCAPFLGWNVSVGPDLPLRCHCLRAIVFFKIFENTASVLREGLKGCRMPACRRHLVAWLEAFVDDVHRGSLLRSFHHGFDCLVSQASLRGKYIWVAMEPLGLQQVRSDCCMELLLQVQALHQRDRWLSILWIRESLFCFHEILACCFLLAFMCFQIIRIWLMCWHQGFLLWMELFLFHVSYSMVCYLAFRTHLVDQTQGLQMHCLPFLILFQELEHL